MAQAKKKIVLTVETDTYDTMKAMEVATAVAQGIREATGPNPVKVAGVAVR